jgi:hypothetical protein
MPLLINDHRDEAETDDQIHSKVVHRAGDWTRRVYGVYWIVISSCIPLQRWGTSNGSQRLEGNTLIPER